jgi:hypothetical protein
LKLSDFYFTGDNYLYRFGPDARQQFIDLLRERFNSGVDYRGRVLKWDTVIEQKTNELGRFLTGKSSSVDFSEHAPKLERSDNRELRAKVLALTASQAKQVGIGKTTLHYLQNKAGQPRRFTMYASIKGRLG